MLVCILIGTLAFVGCDGSSGGGGEEIKYQFLPDAAKTTITRYFDTENITSIKKDGAQYDVRFSDATEIEFASNGQWTEVESFGSGVPTGMIPSKIRSFILVRHKGIAVYKIEVESTGYDVKLANNLEIEFDKSGNFLRYD